LSGISQQIPSSDLSGKSSEFSPPFQSSGILNYVAALAKAEKERDVNAYAAIIDQIGLSKLNIFKLVRDGHVTVETGGFTVRIEFGLLSLSKQQEYVKVHNAWNEAAIEANKQKGPSGVSGGLLGGVKPIGVKWTKTAGQSQRLEKNKLILEIRALQKQIAAINRITMTPGERVSLLKPKEKRLHFARQQLANLLARYKF